MADFCAGCCLRRVDLMPIFLEHGVNIFWIVLKIKFDLMPIQTVK